VCGIVGLFVGCPALSHCPLAEPPAPADGESGGYRSPFQAWDRRAAVRQAPRRVLGEDGPERPLFSPELVPVARHPLVQGLPEAAFNALVVQHLYRYLDFTAKLESLVVNRTMLGIAHGTVRVDVPDEMRFDALKVYCDEAYHTLFSVDLLRQVWARTGVAPRLPDQPYFLRRLVEIQAELPAADRPIAELLFVTVSETLISSTLADLPDADGVEPAVRETIRDHAVDEGRHHAYFAAFLRYLWASFDPATRRRAGMLMPRLIDAFLAPDRTAIRAELVGYGLSTDAAEEVLCEVYQSELVRRQTRNIARQTIRYLAALDVLDADEVVEEFHRYGLIAPLWTE
jgi:hypothetical protein